MGLDACEARGSAGARVQFSAFDLLASRWELRLNAGAVGLGDYVVAFTCVARSMFESVCCLCRVGFVTDVLV